MLMKKMPKSPTVVMTPLADLYLAAEGPKGANLEVRDSGRGSPLSDEELKASLYRAGVIQPLIWKAVDNKLFIIAGNRRLRFLREIFVDAPSTLVPTQNVDDFDGDWREIAIDTNLSLPPHLVERYEIIIKLAQDLKLSEKDTCARFGMSDSQYRRVMALGKMAPKIRQAWKDGHIDAKTAQTFTLEPNPKEQEKIFDSLSKSGYAVRDWDVQRRIVPQTQQEAGKLIRFIGLPVIKKAGLLKQEDLFATERSSNHIVTNMKALNKLVGDRLDKVCAELVASGWKWAMIEGKIEGQRYSYGDIHPTNTRPTKEEKARLEEISKPLGDDEIDSEVKDSLVEERDRIEQAIRMRGFSAEQKAKAGCFVSVSHDGSLSIDYGKVKPAERKSVQSSERARAPATKAKPKKPGEVSLTNALAERLSGSLQQAIAEALKASPHIAVASIIAGFASSGHIIDVDICSRQRSHDSKKNEDHFLNVFEGALKATPEAQQVMLAEVAFTALDIVVRSGEASPPMNSEGLQDLVSALPAKAMQEALRRNFNAEDYFAAIDLKAIVDAVRCSIGNEHADRVAKMKKKEAAAFAASECPKANYLPPMLRTPHYNGPSEQALAPANAAKKDKKPKPVKKPAKKKTRK